jgi:hypothetical protein
MTPRARWSWLPTLVLLVPLAGCIEGTMNGFDGEGGDGKADDPNACEGPLGRPRDPGDLPGCCAEAGGGSHCLPADVVPADFQQYTPACEGGGLCVPDPFIETGGVYKPPACASLNGAEGVCLSACIPEVAGFASILPKEGCGLGEVCVPCISPIDMMPTGACEIAGECVGAGGGGDDTGGQPTNGDDPATCVHEGAPVLDPSGLPACGEGAHCLQAALVPPDFKERLAACPDGASLCVPDVFLESGGNFVPATCRSVNDAEGRCLSKVIPEVAAQAALVPQATCAAGELCVPCFNPLSGADTGACNLSCDTGPAEAAKPLAACCEGRAKCVPTALVPAALQSNLEEAECQDVQADAFLCVPSDLLAYQTGTGPAPRACSATGLTGAYTGVCLSDCLSFGIQGLALARGTCDADYTCAPCKNPLTGQPTGAPGCPAP